MTLAVASACAGAIPAVAQEATRAADEPQSVVVTGLRHRLQSSMNLKRNSDGIVDGIVAEDIGKFPDTNLAESLQRISGVSIDRSIGEGSKITVRGVGPDFNMVLLNGRQMPTSNLGDLNGRAFDFANLASEAISQLQVYKTSRADSPTGGIGATVNVMTARPFERPGLHASIGAKGVYDTTNGNLPGDIKAKRSTTPEISGIYSNTTADGKFGVALTGSYQERNLGYNTAAVSNGWRGPSAATRTTGARFRSRAPRFGKHHQPSDRTDLYSVPQNLNYNFNGVSASAPTPS
jgi:TonB-dependent receptor